MNKKVVFWLLVICDIVLFLFLLSFLVFMIVSCFSPALSYSIESLYVLCWGYGFLFGLSLVLLVLWIKMFIKFIHDIISKAKEIYMQHS